MAAYAALVSLMNTIEQIMNHPRFSTSLDNNQIQSLLEKAGFLLEIIEGNNYGGASKEAEDLERRITSAAHAAEDVIESHIAGQIQAESASSSFLFKLQKKVSYLKKEFKHLKRRIRCAAHAAEDVIEPDQESINFSHHLQQIVEEMDAILRRAHKLKEEEGMRLRSKEEHPTNSEPPMETGETAMVGFEDEMIQIRDELTNQQSGHRVISIVGMGGSGKTTLAKSVYENLDIKQHFDIRAWATISQTYSLTEIFSQLLSVGGKSSNTDIAELGERFYQTLYGRRYLIILDDLWSVEAWDGVSRFLPDNGNGSRVILTSRLSNVANDLNSTCFRKNLLNESESWKLFCTKVFQNEDGCPHQLERVGKEIVALCKGLPLSIVVIGGSLLKSPRTLGHWNSIADSIRSVPNSKEKQESLDVLLSSYHHLPPYLKPCFLYIGFYKSFHHEISVSKIIKLWVAEGFLRSKGVRVLEEIAEDYLKDLIDRNLISVGKRRENGEMKCCEIHDLLRDLCLIVAEQQGFFRVNGGLTQGTERRLIYTRFVTDGRSVETPLLRSIMGVEVPKPALDKCGLLRVLAVVHHTSVEKELFGCLNLRYLSLDIPKKVDSLWRIPTSISLLWNLQTMIFGETFMSYRLVIGPTKIWKMRQLRHIRFPEIVLPHPSLSKGQDDLFILENLQTLKTVVNFWLSEEMCKIIPNVKKLHLCYYVQLEGYDLVIKSLCNLNRLHKLESLKLRAKPDQDIELSKVLTFPISLNKLSLSECQLHWDDLTMIGTLPLLEVLKLEIHAVTNGEEWSPIDGQFLRLKFLSISFCYLYRWNAESFHFPVLEKLVLHVVLSLNEFPWGIGEIPTLELISVDHCSGSAAISAMKIKRERVESQGDDDLQIQVFHNDLDSIMAMMQAEGLTTDNIVLQHMRSSKANNGSAPLMNNGRHSEGISVSGPAC